MLDLLQKREKESTRISFGEKINELAKKDQDIIAIAADTYKSMGLSLFKDNFPERVIDVGIAEQNMMAAAAGIASTGKKVFVACYSIFTSMRALEQLRTFICYPNMNVKIIAGLGGFSAGIEGVTHMAMEDLGIIRCLPNIKLINISCPNQLRNIIEKTVKLNGPIYIRIGRDPTPVIFNIQKDFEIGKANILADDGIDLTIFASGFPLAIAIEAVKILRKKNIFANLIEIHTLKPLDIELIEYFIKNTKKILTIEEHNIIGGLYTAIKESINSNISYESDYIACPDIFTQSGSPNELREYYGLTKENIIKKSIELVKKC